MHGHGGMLIEQLKALHFHMDLHARERMFFYTSTGWMMWNYVASSLLNDVVPVLYDGNPAWPQPDLLWKMVEDSGTSLFGASPTYQAIMEKSGIVPKDRFDFSKLKTILLAGSPVTPECQNWFYREREEGSAGCSGGSGGTDVCTGLVGGRGDAAAAMRVRSRRAALAWRRMRSTSAAKASWTRSASSSSPSRCLRCRSRFWNDEGNKRYLESYFQEFPGVWRHGDFFRINQRGGCFVLGRSDATLNRHGVRIGTAEIYRSLVNLPGVEDALIVNLDLPGGKFFMPLFVKLADGIAARRAPGRCDPRHACAASTRRATCPTRSTRSI